MMNLFSNKNNGKKKNYLPLSSQKNLRSSFLFKIFSIFLIFASKFFIFVMTQNIEKYVSIDIQVVTYSTGYIYI